MNRKSFVGTVAALVGGVSIPFKQSFAETDPEPLYRKPPYLKNGDIIGITSPAGFITQEEIEPAVQVMQNWGYKIVLGDTIGRRDFTFGGTDEERLNDLQKMLDDPKIRAIMCARGGYGSLRIVDRINWTKFKAHPKWIIGFSDITVLHNHIHNKFQIASLHSKMTNSFPDNWNAAEPIQIETINSIRDALSGKRMKYSALPNSNNKQGIADGVLIGGNLKTIESLSGSASDIKTDGKILFVEDTGEYLYSIDRMFWNLKRTGKLKNLKALVVGGFRVKPDDPGEEFGKTIEEIVLEKIKGHNYPVCFDFPVGHQRNNFALKCGVRHRLSVKEDEVILTEII
ncbi:MAG TPA: LD-carboxypeptidase [Flavisolibacter sp.]|nr:LD-carboxypeptidase [Flavisolibacter sp.]